MDSRVVLDCDWFVINQKPHLKQLAFCVVDETSAGTDSCSHTFTFDLPLKAAEFGQDLIKQAKHSHGLVWWYKGGYAAHEVPEAFSTIFECYLNKRPSSVTFYAKGLQKCRLLESWLPSVINLEDLGCSRFDELTNKEQTTLEKAKVFATWLHDQKSETLSPPAPSDAP